MRHCRQGIGLRPCRPISRALPEHYVQYPGIPRRFRATSLSSIDLTPVSNLGHEDNHHIILDCESDPVLPHTMRVQRTVPVSPQFFDIEARVWFFFESGHLVFDPLFAGLWETFEIMFRFRGEPFWSIATLLIMFFPPLAASFSSPAVTLTASGLSTGVSIPSNRGRPCMDRSSRHPAGGDIPFFHPRGCPVSMSRTTCLPEIAEVISLVSHRRRSSTMEAARWGCLSRSADTPRG